MVIVRTAIVRSTKGNPVVLSKTTASLGIENGSRSALILITTLVEIADWVDQAPKPRLRN